MPTTQAAESLSPPPSLTRWPYFPWAYSQLSPSDWSKRYGDRESITFAGLWYIITILPASQLIPHHEAMAEHYLYLPLIGVALLAATAFHRLVAWPRVRFYTYAVGGALLVLLSARTAVRNLDWRDELTLWTKTVQTAPTSARAHFNLGVSYSRLGQDVTAITYYKQALRLDPGTAEALNKLTLWTKTVQRKPISALAHYNLGVSYSRLGQSGTAITYYKQALRLDPAYAEARNNLGREYDRLELLGKAQAEYREAIRLRPLILKYHLNLGRSLSTAGSLDEAIEAFRAAIRLRPNSAQANLQLGIAYMNEGLFEQARHQYLRTLELDPQVFEAHLNLGSIYQRNGDLSRAIQEYQSALSIHPDDADAHLDLGVLYMRTDDDENALEHLRLVTALAPLHPKAEAVRAMIDAIGARSKHGK